MIVRRGCGGVNEPPCHPRESGAPEVAAGHFPAAWRWSVETGPWAGWLGREVPGPAASRQHRIARRSLDLDPAPQPNVESLEHFHRPFERDAEILVPLVA